MVPSTAEKTIVLINTLMSFGPDPTAIGPHALIATKLCKEKGVWTWGEQRKKEDRGKENVNRHVSINIHATRCEGLRCEFGAVPFECWQY